MESYADRINFVEERVEHHFTLFWTDTIEIFFLLRALINMMWSTNVENISSRGNSFGLGPHFCQQNKHIPLKKMTIWTHAKLSIVSRKLRVLNIQE